MVRKCVESLVQSLKAAGYRSEYLDRLGARIDRDQAHDDLRAEIARETAAALARSAEKVDLVLLRLELALLRCTTLAALVISRRSSSVRNEW